MTNVELLEEKIAQSGKKRGYLARKLNLSPQGFRNLVKGETEFKASQIKVLCDELGITTAKEKEAIFFAEIGA